MKQPRAGGLPHQRPLLGVMLIALAATRFATMDSSISRPVIARLRQLGQSRQ